MQEDGTTFLKGEIGVAKNQIKLEGYLIERRRKRGEMYVCGISKKRFYRVNWRVGVGDTVRNETVRGVYVYMYIKCNLCDMALKGGRKSWYGSCVKWARNSQLHPISQSISFPPFSLIFSLVYYTLSHHLPTIHPPSHFFFFFTFIILTRSTRFHPLYITLQPLVYN